MQLKQTLKLTFTAAVSVFFIISATAQKKRLPQNINIPTYSHVYPSVSSDGQSMILMSNYTNSGDFELKFTERNEQGMWENPEPIRNINKPRLDHFGSFYLSHDGKLLLFSSARSRGIGGYDIWYSEKRGKYWSEPKNFGKPLNSTGHEGNPSLSPDGNTLYFMRCEKMNENEEEGCKIFMSKRKSATRWSDPVPLPAPVNTGHELNPRIMIDNRTLVFASGRPGGKGKLDLYMTRNEDGNWSRPEPLTYINTPKNDEFISLTAKGDIAYYTDVYQDKFNIFIAKIPEAFKPDPVILMTGRAVLEAADFPARGAMVRAFDMHTEKRFSGTTASETDGGFFIALPRGARYDFSVFPKEAGYAYHVEVLQLDSLAQSEWIKPEVLLPSLRPGLIIPLPAVSFEEEADSTQLKYGVAIHRLAGFMKKNPGVRIEINVFADSLPKDTTALISLSDQDTIPFSSDSSALSAFRPDSLEAMTDTIMTDSLAVIADTTLADSLVSLIPPEPPFDPAAKSREQAAAIKLALVQYGINPERIAFTGHGAPNNTIEKPAGCYPKVYMMIVE